MHRIKSEFLGVKIYIVYVHKEQRTLTSLRLLREKVIRLHSTLTLKCIGGSTWTHDFVFCFCFCFFFFLFLFFFLRFLLKRVKICSTLFGNCLNIGYASFGVKIKKKKDIGRTIFTLICINRYYCTMPQTLFSCYMIVLSVYAYGVSSVPKFLRKVLKNECIQMQVDLPHPLCTNGE